MNFNLSATVGVALMGTHSVCWYCVKTHQVDSCQRHKFTILVGKFFRGVSNLNATMRDVREHAQDGFFIR